MAFFLFFFYRERDSDRDGKVNFKEFFHGLFDLVRNYDDEGHNSSHPSDDTMDAPARQLFGQLDKDGDGYSLKTKDTLLLCYIDEVTLLYVQTNFICLFTLQIFIRCWTTSYNWKTPSVRALLCKTTSGLHHITGIQIESIRFFFDISSCVRCWLCIANLNYSYMDVLLSVVIVNIDIKQLSGLKTGLLLLHRLVLFM